jgi:hypothetical protein
LALTDGTSSSMPGTATRVVIGPSAMAGLSFTGVTLNVIVLAA